MMEGEKRRFDAWDDGTSNTPKRQKTHIQNAAHFCPVREVRKTMLSTENYTVGWICALPIEMTAARAMLDDIHEPPPSCAGDDNTYIVGSIGKHNIVITCLPQYGTNDAAVAGRNMQRTFYSIRIRLMVGIGGGAPGKVDVRLGDVIVGIKIIQHDIGKALPNGNFQHTSTHKTPPNALLSAVNALRAEHRMQTSEIPKILSQIFKDHSQMNDFRHPGVAHDWLFQSSYDHTEQNTWEHMGESNSCTSCDKSQLVPRLRRDNADPMIHYGNIASGNVVMKDSKKRDQLAKDLDVICFEMEAAGLMDHFPCLVIRGICDYSDSHKLKQWQPYAAAVAAAYTKELLSIIPASEITNSSSPLRQSEPDIQMQHQLYDGSYRTQSMLSEDQLRDRRKILIDALKFELIDSRHQSIKAAHAKTCEWFLKHVDYVNWLDPSKFPEHHGLLWINGKPGTGKSTLMKFAYTRAKKSTGGAITISFFFNARGEDLERSTEGMMRSLVSQLIETLPDLQDLLDDFILSDPDQNSHPTWDIERLQTIFSKAVKRLGQRTLTCFIDALDECDEDQIRSMIEFLEDLGDVAVEDNIQLYICLSSRHYPHIDIRNGKKMVLESQSGHEEDLQKYVHRRLNAGKGKAIEQVKAKILEKASGIFLWAVLVIDILNKEFERGRMFAVKKRLEEIPDKLSDLFKDILTRDGKNMNDLLLCISWILFAKRPLNQQEFYYAMVSRLDPDPENLAQWDPENLPGSAMELFVLSSSKGLAEVIKSKQKIVQFIHESVRDFLIKDDGIRQLWPEIGNNLETWSHDQLKECCYTYMKTHMLTVAPPTMPLPKASTVLGKNLRYEVSQNYPFLEYATQNVLYHANCAPKQATQSAFLETFDLKAWIHLDNLFALFDTRRHTLEATFVYIFAENGFAELIGTLPDNLPRLNVRGERYKYPIYAALANGHQTAAKALFQQDTCMPDEEVFLQLPCGSDFTLPKHNDDLPILWAIDIRNASLLKRLIDGPAFESEWGNKGQMQLVHRAVQLGAESIIKVLLEAGDFDLNSNDTSQRTPLLCAAAGGHEAVTKLLLSAKGIDVDASDQQGQSALSLAAERGHEGVVKLLLAVKDIEVNSLTRSGHSALSLAAECGHEGVVKLLLAAKDIEVNSLTRSGHSALPLAAECGHEGVLKLLLAEKDIEVNSLTPNGRPALSLAAEHGHEGVVKLLLAAKDIEVNRLTPSGYSALLLAAAYGHEGVVKLLLAAKDIEVNRLTPNGHSALSLAAERGHEGVVKLLLAAKDIEVNSLTSSGHSALLLAAACGHEGVVKLLLAKKGIDVNILDGYGRSVLSFVARHGCEGIVRLLLAAKGIDVHAVDKNYMSPLQYAIDKGNNVVVDMLLEAGAVYQSNST